MTMFTEYGVWDNAMWCVKNSCQSPLMSTDDNGTMLLADMVNAAQEHEREVHREGAQANPT